MSPSTSVKHLHCYSCLDGLTDTAVLGSGSRWIKSCCRRQRVINNLMLTKLSEADFQVDWRHMLEGPDGCFIGYKYICITIDEVLSKEGQIFSYP